VGWAVGLLVSLNFSQRVSRLFLNMKTKLLAGLTVVALVAVVVIGSVGVPAMAQQRAPAGKTFLLKAAGETIAELRMRRGAELSIKAMGSADHVDFDMATQTFHARGGVRLNLTMGTNSVWVQADEIESLPILDDRVIR
jgi:hypothetical protein